MSALAANPRNAKSSGQPPMEAVVVNSIIYSKPSFCTIAIDLGDVPSDKFPMSSKLKRGNYPNNSVFQNDVDLNNPFWTNLSVPPPPPDAKVYRMCTTINGSVQHQISELCDNILAIAGLFGVDNNDHDDDSLIDFGFKDDHNLVVGDDLDDDDDDEEDDEDEDDYESENLDDDDDDDDDVVDFSYECPIEPILKLSCDKKKKVCFNAKPTVHLMHTWSYAYRTARKGEWEMYARDRERFKLRIHRAALILNQILERGHRQKIYEKRFASLYNNDGEDVFQQQAKTTETLQTNVAANVKDPVEKAMENESKNSHQKKKRRKRRFCKMGNKHYF